MIAYPPGAYRFQQDFYDVQPEPGRYAGLIHLTSPEGLHQGTRKGLTEEAIADRRVIVYVDGIHQSLEEQQRQIRELLCGGAPEAGVALGRPILGVHEGSGKTILHDSHRQAGNLVHLKALQIGEPPADWLRHLMFQNDPAVKSTYNLVKQSLNRGLDVSLIAHSGGGIEAAVALTLLSLEGRHQEIGEKVRVLSLASGVSPKDFELAGVKPEHLYYTGSTADIAYQLARNFLPVAIPGALGGALEWALDRPEEEVLAHSPDYLLAANPRPELASFLLGQAAGRHVEVA